MTATLTESSTVLQVTWQPLTIVEARGFINYVVTAREGNSMKVLTKIAVMNQNSVTFEGVDTSAEYSVSVYTMTISTGEIGPGEGVAVIVTLTALIKHKLVI